MAAAGEMVAVFIVDVSRRSARMEIRKGIHDPNISGIHARGSIIDQPVVQLNTL